MPNFDASECKFFHLSRNSNERGQAHFKQTFSAQMINSTQADKIAIDDDDEVE